MLEKKKQIIACGIALGILLASVIYIRTGHSSFLSQAVFADILLLLILSISVMVGALRSSLRVTLYSYRNISLIAGILFSSVLVIALLSFSVSCLQAREISLDQLYRTVLGFPRKFSYYALFVIIAVSLLLGVSNISLIRHEGFCLNNALSLLVAGVYIGGTVLVYWLSDILTDRVFAAPDRLSVVLGTVTPLFLVLMLCYFECILAGTAIMGWKAARQKPAYDKDYIIILGCSIDRRGGLLPLLKGRVNRAIRYAWEQEIATGKPVKYVPSGGQGANEVMSEGSAMELYLLTRGAEDYEVFPEKESTSTWENMCFSKRIIDGLKPDAKVAFATTNYHMLRSGILARKAGLDAEGIAGDTKWYFWPNGFVREFFGILKLSINAHLGTAILMACLCAALGCIGYFGAPL